MRDTHQVVIDDMRKIVGRIAVCFHQDLILQLLTLTLDFTENRILIGDSTVERHFLANHVRSAGCEFFLYFCRGQPTAVAVIAAGCVFFVQLLKSLFGAETIVSMSRCDKLFGVFAIDFLSFALNIRTMFAADVGTFVVTQPRHT